jgi:hypothetical protein
LARNIQIFSSSKTFGIEATQMASFKGSPRRLGQMTRVALNFGHHVIMAIEKTALSSGENV